MGKDLRVGFPTMAKDHKRCPISQLNDHLLSLILTKVGDLFQVTFKLCCVCKRWNTLITDDYFRRNIFRMLCQTPLYIVYRQPNEVAACDIRMKDWHKWTWAIHKQHFSLWDVDGHAGDWLLVLERRLETQFENFSLFNLKKKSLKKFTSLPPKERGGYHEVGMFYDEKSKSHKAFVVKIEKPEGRFPFPSYKVYQYDIERDAWESFGPWQKYDGEMMHEIMFYGGAWHSIKSSCDRSRSSVCRFDGGSRWQELLIPVPQELQIQHLFEWQGHLMLIGRTDSRTDRGTRLASVHIWQFSKGKQVWVEFMRMPDHMVNHLYSSKVDEYAFGLGYATYKDQICLTSAVVTLDKDGLCSQEMTVMCDLAKRVWWDVPELPFSYSEHHGFSVLMPKSELEAAQTDNNL